MVSNDFDIRMMQRALELATAGTGKVSPNPLVGCVITSASGETVGEGTYLYENVTHAEVLALSQAGERARGGTAYVSLEPHAHHGKTPPCTDALIEAGITRVVASIEDPNPLVSGKGFEQLRRRGMKVSVGICADEGKRINEKFCVWHRKQRPFVHLKLAMSLDGRISLNSSVSTALSGSGAVKRVHELRHEHDAILVGINTALVDDPSLTDRSGLSRRRKLMRVVLDNRLRIAADSNLVRSALQTPTTVFTGASDPAGADKLRKFGVEVVELERGCNDLAAVLSELRKRGIQSVLVEGGSTIAGAFCDARLVDKLTFIFAPLVIGGHAAPVAIGGSGAAFIETAWRVVDMTVAAIGEDIEITGYPEAA